MQETVLITGGSGLVGTRLTELLIDKGYAVKHMSRTRNLQAKAPAFKWDLGSGDWDRDAIEGVRYIINLAGAGIADARWTANRKAEILDSRVKSSALVCEMVKASNGKIKGVISSSAVGYYGVDKYSDVVTEQSEPGEDFMAQVCIDWENAIMECSKETKVAIVRTGIVLSTEGGALPKMALPIKLGVGSPIGNGQQSMPWIHIDDLCTIYLFMMENSLEGTYNAVAPAPVSNKVFTKELAKALHRKIIFPNVPSFVLKLIFGEMAQVLLTGVSASSKKIETSGFTFGYAALDLALEDLYSSK